MFKTQPNTFSIEARRSFTTVEDLEKSYPVIEGLGPARKQGIRLMLVLGWRLEDVIPRSGGRSLYKWSKPDGSWDGTRDVIEICQTYLKPMNVMHTVKGYEYSLMLKINELLKAHAEQVLGESLIEC